MVKLQSQGLRGAVFILGSVQGSGAQVYVGGFFYGLIYGFGFRFSIQGCKLVRSGSLGPGCEGVGFRAWSFGASSLQLGCLFRGVRCVCVCLCGLQFRPCAILGFRVKGCHLVPVAKMS